jgi:hypothetical protein
MKAPVHASDISQERVDETAKGGHEFECPRCGHCCQQREWVEQPDLARVGEVGVWGDKWVGLTDEERDYIWEKNKTKLGGWDHGGDEVMYDGHFGDAVIAIEAKLKERNT